MEFACRLSKYLIEGETKIGKKIIWNLLKYFQSRLKNFGKVLKSKEKNPFQDLIEVGRQKNADC